LTLISTGKKELGRKYFHENFETFAKIYFRIFAKINNENVKNFVFAKIKFWPKFRKNVSKFFCKNCDFLENLFVIKCYAVNYGENLIWQLIRISNSCNMKLTDLKVQHFFNIFHGKLRGRIIHFVDTNYKLLYFSRWRQNLIRIGPT